MSSSTNYANEKPIGMMSKKELYINHQLTFQEKLSIIQKLINAKGLGYECCIVTLSGTYATKKL